MQLISGYLIRQVAEQGSSTEDIANELLEMYKRAKLSGNMSDIYNNYYFRMGNQTTSVTVENNTHTYTNEEQVSENYTNGIQRRDAVSANAHIAVIYPYEIVAGDSQEARYMSWTYYSDCCDPMIHYVHHTVVGSTSMPDHEGTYKAFTGVESRGNTIKPWAVNTVEFEMTESQNYHEVCTRNAAMFLTNIPKFGSASALNDWYSIEYGYLHGTVTDSEFLAFLNQNLVP